MQDEGLSSGMRDFIEKYIFSVEQLEILLLLASQPRVDHSVEAVYERILSSKLSVEVWLNRFADLQLVEKATEDTVTYRFRPASPEQAALVADLIQVYQAMPVRVIEAIYSRRRLDSSDADPDEGFADARFEP